MPLLFMAKPGRLPHLKVDQQVRHTLHSFLLQTDIIAGISVGAMVVPQGMSYAKLAGLPNVYGLYGAFVPVLVYAALGSSPQLVMLLFTASIVVNHSCTLMLPCTATAYLAQCPVLHQALAPARCSSSQLMLLSSIASCYRLNCCQIVDTDNPLAILQSSEGCIARDSHNGCQVNANIETLFACMFQLLHCWRLLSKGRLLVNAASVSG